MTANCACEYISSTKSNTINKSPQVRSFPISMQPNQLFRNGLSFDNDRRFKNSLILKAILLMTGFLLLSTILFVCWSKYQELETEHHIQQKQTIIIRQVPLEDDTDTGKIPSVLTDVQTQYVPPTTYFTIYGGKRSKRDLNQTPQLKSLPVDEYKNATEALINDSEDNQKENQTRIQINDQIERDVTNEGSSSPTKNENPTMRPEVKNDIFWTSKKDRESIRKYQAERMLSYMDLSVDPCNDFYQYACGRWGHNHPIPEDRGGYDTFEMLRDNLESVLRDLLLEPSNNDTEAVTKAKTMFRSCMNEEIVEERGNEPLMNLLPMLGGWPVIDESWNSSSFNWIQVVSQLKLYNNDILIYQWVGLDFNDSSRYIIELDQPPLGLPTREYFLQERNEIYVNAYTNFIMNVSLLMGAEPHVARRDAVDIVLFEKELAKITVPQEERRNVSKIYEKLTLSDLETQIPEISWKQYLDEVLNTNLTSTEPIALYARNYFTELVHLIAETNSRTVANYMMWRFVKNRINNLGQKYQEAKQEIFRVLSGREKMPARTNICVTHVNSNMGMAVGSIFVKRYFDENSKNDTLIMTNSIRNSFKSILNNIDWIDEDTRRLSQDKIDAMILRIGYPDLLLDHEELSNLYKNVIIEEDKYFENTLELLKHVTRLDQGRLAKIVNKTEWSTQPALVNAYYSRNRNQIIVPAGILQPPFYHRHFPRSLNYGGIGVVIGHEITHGFDDRGRLFDIDGNLHRWWNDGAIEGFRQRAKCLIEQYNKYTVQEIDMKINGINTQGENIADNGGIKQAFRAYEKWLSNNGEEDETLPTLNVTNRQLFFINFAQVWCGAMRPETSRNKIQTAVHSPGRFRVIGTLSNTEDFTRVFNCPPSTGMNPQHKCSVW